MAKISSTLSYPSIGTVVGTDYWVLTDAESDLATKSVSVNQIQKFLGLEGSAVSQVTVTSAQLLNLANVPMNLIAAPGTDKIIDILSIAVFSDFDTTTVATPLPIKFVIARASDMKRSTPNNNAIPSTGIIGNAANVAAKVINPEPVTPAAPLDVSINTPNKVASCQKDKSMPYA